MGQPLPADYVALESIESAAFADLYRAAPEAIRTALRIDVTNIAGVTCLSCAQLQPPMIFRRACGLGVESPLRAAQLESVLRHMDGLGES